MDIKNPIPPKIYRNMLAKHYIQTKRDYQKILERQRIIHNPICQKEDRYNPPKTKGSILSQEYFEKMMQKPEKAHKKRIPIKDNLTSGVVVMTEPNKPPIRKVRQEQLNRASSAQKRNIGKKIVLDSYKKFYYDDFDSSKLNQTDIKTTNKKIVRNILNNIFHLIFRIYIIKKITLIY